VGHLAFPTRDLIASPFGRRPEGGGMTHLAAVSKWCYAETMYNPSTRGLLWYPSDSLGSLSSHRELLD
jgi:hypothetical protein